MKRVSAMLSAAAVVVMTAGVLAQAPNFSGKWTRDAPAAPAGGPGGGGRGGRGGFGGGGWGMNPTITQDATTLTVEYMAGGQNPTPVKVTYKLDGSESKNMMPGRGGGAPTEQVSKATVAGATIKIVTTTQFGEQTRTISMDGGKLKIESSQNGPDGTPITTTTTYTKG